MYMARQGFSEASTETGMAMKEVHSLVQKWPTRLKQKKGEKDARKEFQALLASGFSCTERYVEWERSV
ncbi:hypothetical protein F5883DRAFT_591392 [Diaporthe sp. PMI_573]|nr:hypothetical protein F5883DRAFT_591392 [Diaporthaceae sp. PMI_573]